MAIITEASATTSIAYRNFIHSLKSSKTRADYLRSLGYYMSFLKVELQGERNDYYEKLLQQDPKIIASDIIDFIIHLKDQKKVSPATINSYVAAIRHFYDMNEVDLKWKKINSFKGEFYNVVEDRPYAREEIKLMVDHADLRNRAIILLMASSGMRVGALPELKIKDFLPIDKYRIYQITVYKKSRSKYITFCTPEARKQIDSYLQWRERCGERLKPDSPLFRKEFDVDDRFEVDHPKPLTVWSIHWVLSQLLNSSGVRPPKHMTADMKHPERTELMQAHGFRKFFDTTCTNAGMNPVYTELLMGHSLGLKSRYAKPSPGDLLEGNDKNLGYASMIDVLTINEENRLRKQVEYLKIEKSEIDKLRDEVKGYRSLGPQILSLKTEMDKLKATMNQSIINEMLSKQISL